MSEKSLVLLNPSSAFLPEVLILPKDVTAMDLEYCVLLAVGVNAALPRINLVSKLAMTMVFAFIIMRAKEFWSAIHVDALDRF